MQSALTNLCPPQICCSSVHPTLKTRAYKFSSCKMRPINFVELKITRARIVRNLVRWCIVGARRSQNCLICIDCCITSLVIKAQNDWRDVRRSQVAMHRNFPLFLVVICVGLHYGCCINAALCGCGCAVTTCTAVGVSHVASHALVERSHLVL